MAHEVFISYSHLNAETAEAVAERLERDGISCWYAPRDIGPGDEWASAIVKALNACRVMVLVVSDASNASVQVLREVNNAISAGKTIIPYKITETDLTDAMQYYLSTLQWLDATGKSPEKSLEELYTRVREVLTGENEGSRKELPAQSVNTKKKRRREIRGAFSSVFRISAIIVNALFGFISIGTFTGLCGFRNSNAVGFIGLFLGSLTILFFQITRLIDRPVTKYHWLICTGICLLIMTVTLIVGRSFDRGFPTGNLPDNGQEIGMNVMNHSYAIRSKDGMVYFCHNESGESPSIRRCTYEQFLAGDKGEELVGNVWSDNLALAGDRYLAFRDYTDNKPSMKLYDIDTGEITVLKKRGTYCYYGADDAIFYGQDTSSSTSVGVITLDGRFDGEYINQDCSSGWICFYNRDIYYINPSGFLQNHRSGDIGAEHMDRFLIYDNVIYYHAGKGGVYRAPLNDPGNAEELCENSVLSMAVCQGYLYYLNENDSDYLYRVPIDGGEKELVLTGTFSEINVIGDCLYISDSAESYTRLDVNKISIGEPDTQ